jgi:hypothetical protein
MSWPIKMRRQQQIQIRPSLAILTMANVPPLSLPIIICLPSINKWPFATTIFFHPSSSNGDFETLNWPEPKKMPLPINFT